MGIATSPSILEVQHVREDILLHGLMFNEIKTITMSKTIALSKLEEE